MILLSLSVSELISNIDSLLYTSFYTLGSSNLNKNIRSASSIAINTIFNVFLTVWTCI